MKVKKIIKTVITVLAVFIAVIIIKNPDKALATQTGEDDVYAELTDVQLDDSHSINIYAHTHVSYAYDEGAYGWIVDGYVVGNDGVGSDNVNVEVLQIVYSLEMKHMILDSISVWQGEHFSEGVL